MGFPNAKNDVCCILSWFSGAFSRPSFKVFSSYVVSFIQLGKEAHTASMVKAVSTVFLAKSLSGLLAKYRGTAYFFQLTKVQEFSHLINKRTLGKCP